MYSLVVLSVASVASVACASAATPFFESPHNERASAFYKVPVHHHHVYSAPSYQPSPVYKQGPVYSAAPVFPYKPEPSVYKPEPSVYKPEPSVYKPEPPFYQPAYKGEHGHGATSFQSVQLGGGPGYGHGYKPYF